MAYFDLNSGFTKLSTLHESNSLEHGNSGNSTIRLDTADEVEVTHIQGTIWSSSQASGSQKWGLVSLALTPTTVYLSLLPGAQKSCYQAALTTQVNILTISLVQYACNRKAGIKEKK